MMILADLSTQGNPKEVRSLAEPLQPGMEIWSKARINTDRNKRHFLEVSAEIIERVDSILFGDPMTATLKAPGKS